MLFSFVPYAPLPSYLDRGHDCPARVYSAYREIEMRDALAQLADLAVQREIEGERSSQSEMPPQ